MKAFTFTLLLSLFLCSAQAQSLARMVIGSAGFESTLGEIQLSCTIGEAIVGSQPSTEINLFQGYQQLNSYSTAPQWPTATTPPFSFYPNPCKDYLQIELHEVGRQLYQVTLHDMMGREVISRKGQMETSFRLQLPSMKPGIYLISIQIGTAYFYEKVVITS
jgi:hypothetical protein